MRYFKNRSQSILANAVSSISSVVFSGLGKNAEDVSTWPYLQYFTGTSENQSYKSTRTDGVISFLIFEISATKKLHYFHKAEGTLSEAATIHSNCSLPVAPLSLKMTSSKRQNTPLSSSFPNLDVFRFPVPQPPFLTLQ